jgi:hypothetical protein
MIILAVFVYKIKKKNRIAIIYLKPCENSKNIFKFRMNIRQLTYKNKLITHQGPIL